MNKIDMELDALNYIEKIAELEYERVNTMLPENIEAIDDKIKEYLEKYIVLTKTRQKNENI